MIFIAPNQKGGVGKSTLQNQIMTAYLHSKTNKKVRLIEIDDENEDSIVFTQTEILDAKIMHTSEIRKLDEIFYEKDDIVIDVGGNKTSTILLEEIKKIGEFENITWFIPMGSGEMDSTNALSVYEEIMEMDEKAKVIFILSNAKTDDEKWEFMNFFGSDFLDIEFAILDHIPTAKHITIKNSTVINHARFSHKTFLDLALDETDYKAEYKASKKDKKDKEASKKLKLRRLKNEAIEYLEYLKIDVFPKLDELLK